MNYTFAEAFGARAGDIISINGKRHLILKKTTTAMSAIRWFVWDDWINKLTGGRWANRYL